MRLPDFLIRIRTYTALISTWLLNLGMFGFKLKSVCSPGLTCHGCPWATFACPVGVMTFSSAVHALPVLAIGFVLAVGSVTGRIICGFVCPFGLLQDLLHKIPSRKLKLFKVTRYFKYVALGLLVLLFPYMLGFEQSGYLAIDNPRVEPDEYDQEQLVVDVAVENLGTVPVVNPEVIVRFRNPVTGVDEYHTRLTYTDIVVPPGEGAPLPYITVPRYLEGADLLVESPQSTVSQTPRYDLYYCRVCPVGTLTAALPAYASGRKMLTRTNIGRDAVRLGVLAIFIVLMVFVSRPFCRTFCPLGAMYGLISRFAVLRLVVDNDTCIKCGRCDKVCPVDLDVVKEAGGAECMACGDCIRVCPTDAISRRFGV